MKNPGLWFKYYLRYRLGDGKKKAAHTQAWIAEKAGVSQPYINKLLKTDDGQLGKEETRRGIVSALEDTYETAYEIGMQLLRTGKVSDSGDVTDLMDVKAEKHRVVLLEHRRIIEEFEDDNRALNISRMLLQLKKVDPERLNFVEKFIELEVSRLPKDGCCINHGEDHPPKKAKRRQA